MKATQRRWIAWIIAQDSADHPQMPWQLAARLARKARHDQQQQRAG